MFNFRSNMKISIAHIKDNMHEMIFMFFFMTYDLWCVIFGRGCMVLISHDWYVILNFPTCF